MLNKDFIAIEFLKNVTTHLFPEYRQQVNTIFENLKRNFSDTNKKCVHTALITPQTPQAIKNRVVKDYRNAYQLMGM